MRGRVESRTTGTCRLLKMLRPLIRAASLVVAGLEGSLRYLRANHWTATHRETGLGRQPTYSRSCAQAAA